MQRAEALRDLSREHHEALVLARHARATAGQTASAEAHAQSAHLLQRWTEQFEPHFAREEQTLLPALAQAGQSAPVALAREQHATLRGLVARLRTGDLQALATWGEAMDAHVRFEERTLFPLAQTVLEPSVLTDVMNRTAHPSPLIS
ncbi:MAG: hemerythrin domain-containing protein [Rhodoferax sp.]